MSCRPQIWGCHRRQFVVPTPLVVFRGVMLAVLCLGPAVADEGSSAAASGARATTPSSDMTVREFALQDYRGREHHLSEYGEAKVVVLAFLGTECPLVRLYGPRLQDVADRFSSEQVVFLGVNSNRQDSLTDIAAFARRHGVQFPILKDVQNRLADAVGAERTPEVVVLGPEVRGADSQSPQRPVLYRGRIDDQYGVGYSRDQPQHTWLTDALQAVLQDRRPAVRHVATEGCLIGRVREVQHDSDVTYGEHIAPILNAHCVECHRDGEIAPFALTRFDEVVGWADMIREVTRDNRMPPWHADPAHGRFANSRGLSTAEKQLLNDWALAGAPAGNLSSLPEPPAKADGWQLATAPDQVVSMDETFTVPAEGTVKYKYFQVDPGFKEDKWIRAAEVVPGSRDVVHHILVFARAAGSRRSDPGAGGGSFLAAYVPGLRAAELPPGMAKRVPAGSKLVFQMHYTPVGEQRTDRSSIGLYFADEADVDKVVVTQETLNRRFSIPPGDPEFQVEATSSRAPMTVEVLALMPHMHLRGKSFRYEAVLPDGQRTTLLDVPAYDFNWQTAYRLETPLAFPTGSRMHCVAYFDNSERNLNNPNPSATVGWGDQTWNEMMIGYYDVAVPRRTLENGLAETDEVLAKFDKNGDGRIQKQEVPRKLLPVFTALDVDGNEEVDRQELRKLSAVR
ncbi:MAG: redoxin domain-containing protein [Fuerstiella sp.]